MDDHRGSGWLRDGDKFREYYFTGYRAVSRILSRAAESRREPRPDSLFDSPGAPMVLPFDASTPPMKKHVPRDLAGSRGGRFLPLPVLIIPG